VPLKKSVLSLVVVGVVVGGSILWFNSQSTTPQNNAAKEGGQNSALQTKASEAKVTAIPNSNLVSRHSSVVPSNTSSPKRQKTEIEKENSPPAIFDTTSLRNAANDQYRVSPQYYMPATITPRGRTDLIAFAAKPVSVKEITEKRKKLAKGERLYRRVVKKREADETQVHAPNVLVQRNVSNISKVREHRADTPRTVEIEKNNP
jgi:hypothetical protein